MNPYKLFCILFVALLLAFPNACTSSSNKGKAPGKATTTTTTLFTGGSTGDSGDDDDDDDDDDDGGTRRSGNDLDCDDVVTYDDHIQDLMDRDCISCHDRGGSEPELETYDDVRRAATKSLAEVEDGSMPQGGDEWSRRDIQLLEDWIDQGRPETEDDVRCKGDGNRNNKDNDRFDKDKVRRDLLESDDYKDCVADDRIYMRDRRRQCCTSVRIADFKCNLSNLEDEFRDTFDQGLERYLSRQGYDIDDYDLEQCGEGDNGPVAVFVRDVPSGSNSVELEFLNLNLSFGRDCD